jgi:hypothetical protein
VDEYCDGDCTRCHRKAFEDRIELQHCESGIGTGCFGREYSRRQRTRTPEEWGNVSILGTDGSRADPLHTSPVKQLARPREHNEGRVMRFAGDNLHSQLNYLKRDGDERRFSNPKQKRKQKTIGVGHVDLGQKPPSPATHKLIDYQYH